jgi:hypothetical protein
MGDRVLHQGRVAVWRVSDRQQVATLKIDLQFPGPVALSPDSAVIAVKRAREPVCHALGYLPPRS